MEPDPSSLGVHGSLGVALAATLVILGAVAPAPGFDLTRAIELDGYVKLDLSWDEKGMASPGEFVKWLAPRGDSGEEWNVTVNQTRLGLTARGFGESLVASGRVEIDFYGALDRPEARVRHAFGKLAWPEAGQEILIGQTSDVISPLTPPTLNYTVAWWAGNIGFRRPQLRWTRRSTPRPDTTLTLMGALTHNIYDTRVGAITAEDSGASGVQARVGVGFDRGEGRSWTLGVSGHRADETFETSGGGDCPSWSANLDGRWTRGPLRLEGELYTGASLGPYLGAIGQGAHLDPLQAIRGRGGWLAGSWAPGGRLRGAVGFSVDQVPAADLDLGDRQRNRSIFANVILKAPQAFELGFEVSHWGTDYAGTGGVDGWRGQLSIVRRF